MADELKHRVAIVTGGSSGIGAGIGERFATEGACVVIADVNQEGGEAFAKKIGPSATFKKTDTSNPEQVRALVDHAVETFGGLDVMVNYAGISGARRPDLLADDFADFQRVMGINLLGVMMSTREAARHMSEHGGGSIINVSSRSAPMALESTASRQPISKPRSWPRRSPDTSLWRNRPRRWLKFVSS